MSLARLILVRFVLAVVFATSWSHGAAGSSQDGDRERSEPPPWPEWVTAEDGGFQVAPVTTEEAELWLRWVIPLPKCTDFKGKLVLPVTNLAVRLRANAGDVEHNARQELEALLPKKASGRAPESRFPILIGVSDAEGKIDGTPIPGAARLRERKNEDQAYLITPLSEPGIAVTGLTERGVYYGVKTLQQLLEGHSDQDNLTMPIVRVLDWPDLAERGQWGGSSTGDIQYLADRKMNLIEAHSQFWIDDQGRGRASIDTESQQQARLHAIKWVPIVTHLDHLDRTGIFKRYPELKGKGPHAQHRTHSTVMAACFSQPKTAEILADWFASLASIKGVTDINVWLSEIEGIYCECPECKDKGQYVLETEAAVRAWQLARRQHSHVRLRILLTQGSYPTNDKVLAATPPEVGITYYSGRHTYDSSQTEMIYPLLADFANRGRWLGCYPQLTASWRIVCPWSGPQFIKYRMTEFVDKGLSCLCGYATPDNRFYDFNVTAAAEWSWNAHGRSEHEFSAAWATRRGLSDPDKAAEWAVMLGPVAWDVYASRVPYNQFFGSAARMVARREPPASLVESGTFRHFPTVRDMDADLATCEKALALAKELREPALIVETEVIQGYVEMIKAIYVIAEAVAGQEGLEPTEKQLVQSAFDELVQAGRHTTEALDAWKKTAAPDCTAPRIADTVNVTRQTVVDVGKALAPFGTKQTENP